MISRELEIKRSTKTWYLLSLIIPVIGGIIMMFVLLNRDKRTARNGLIISGSWIVIIVSIFGLMPLNSTQDNVPVDHAVSSGSPSSPINFGLEAPDFGHIKVSWSVPSDSGNSPITGYVVQYRKANEEWKDIAINSNEFSADITELSPGMYFVRVLAKNAIGLGQPSIQGTITLA